MPMFNHILVPTDGSGLSMKAVRTAIALAREMKARLSALYVMAESSYYSARSASA